MEYNILLRNLWNENIHTHTEIQTEIPDGTGFEMHIEENRTLTLKLDGAENEKQNNY